MKILDPHIHLFNLSLGSYQWLKADNPPFWPDKHLINRDFNKSDLNLMSPNKLAGFVHIEAGFDNQQPLKEITWLESALVCPATPFFRSIAYLDITLPAHEFIAVLGSLKKHTSVVGIRYILDDDAPTLLNTPQIIENLTQLAKANLLFEAQLNLSDTKVVKPLIKLLEMSLKVTINHAGTHASAFLPLPNENWFKNIKKLSTYENCAIKCSGWELVNREYTQATQTEVINHCLAYFGENRVMLASNFPLVLFSESYNDYWKKLTEIEIWSEALKTKIFYENSYHWYEFDSSMLT